LLWNTLPNDTVLMAGGTTTASAELYIPYSNGSACTSPGECESGFCIGGYSSSS
jgi:hypothetical protein